MMKIMKILEIHMKINKNYEILRKPNENHENHENLMLMRE